MQSADDSAWLREYAENNSDEAFAALVTRHVNLVYSVAMRGVGNPAWAEEITQAVFIILARKAGQLRNDKALSSWLFKTTQLTANNFLRSELRRQSREQEAHDMQTILNEPELWPRIAPLLDNAVAALNEKDRRAILLRFYEGKNLREIGNLLGSNESAAEKRVSRALEKLRKFFTKRGVDSTTAAIAENISAHSIQVAPVALAKTVTAVAIAKGATASASTLTLIKGALKIMAWTKMKMAVVFGVAAILAVGTTTVVVKEINNRPGYYKGKSLKEWLKNLDDQNPGLANDEAANAVRHIGTNGLPVIISLLQINNPLHHSAVLACQELGVEAKPAIPALMKLLNDGYANGYVGVAMDRIGQDGITPLIEALTNENSSVRFEVIHALGDVLIYSGNTRAFSI